MIHVLRWAAIIGVCWFFRWVQHAQPRKIAYRKRAQRSIGMGRRMEI